MSSGLSETLEAHVRAAADVGESVFAALPKDGRPWWKKPHLLRLNFILFSCILFSSANGYDGTMMNGLQALPQWQKFMNHPKGAWLGFINSTQSVGAMVAVFPSAWTVQHFGRKTGVYLGYLFLAVGVALQTAAPNEACFIVARFFLGLASQFYANSASILITETAYPSHRGICTALYNCGWFVGSIIAAWATFGTRNCVTSWSWRIPSLLQIAIPVIALPGFLMSPESPRYLVFKGQIDDAKQVLIKYHNGGVRNALVDLELEEMMVILRAEREAKENTSWADMFRSKGNRHRSLISITLGVFSQWNGVGVVSYYFVLVLEAAGITDTTDQTLLNGCIQIWNLLLATGAAFSVDRLGRRKLFLVSGFGMLVSYICITGLSGSFAETGAKDAGISVIPFLFLFYGFYDIAFTPLFVSYPAEIWPYSLRAQGIASAQLSAQVAIFFNIFVNPIALDAIGWKYYIVFVIILIILILTVWFFYPETKGHTLEEMATIFDGADAATPARREILDHIARNKRTDVDMIHIEEAA
ncbi:sugar transporter [Aspergillus uvarum CBS 121591]|uniref:Sugar transporter n=1 Tax=Aspergillus uvarum CBS 121591 TaxID=1448315 RepID=A0A319CJX3_9EURO|nr:sugar transporter [Aspergillus uvarum CBS 121591]PYH84780.1 sugar transporter [Aspergillus uvarum CBS 121591]